MQMRKQGNGTGGFNFLSIGIPGITAIWNMSLLHHKREVLLCDRAPALRSGIIFIQFSVTS
jgi:hypothetical protein